MSALDLQPHRAYRDRGKVANLAGLAAESQVKAVYERRGLVILAERWRGSSGEIDLVFRDNDQFVFVEVKRSKSLEIAAQRLSKRQLARITSTGEEFLNCLALDLATPMRFDLACVDGSGEIEIVENITLS